VPISIGERSLLYLANCLLTRNSKLAEWSDNEEEVEKVFAPKKNKWAKYCIVKHAFKLADLEEDISEILEIKEEMREEAEKFGSVTNVTLYDKEEDGIVCIRFREFEAAEKFQKANNGRHFGGPKIEVTIPDDRFKFRKSARDEEPDSSDEERLEKVAQESVIRD
jgi:HIV Tat-specific factor 1